MGLRGHGLAVECFFSWSVAFISLSLSSLWKEHWNWRPKTCVSPGVTSLQSFFHICVRARMCKSRLHSQLIRYCE